MPRSQQRLRYRYGVDSDNMTAWQYGEPSLAGPEQQNARCIARGTTPPAMPASKALTITSTTPATLALTAPVTLVTVTGTGYIANMRVVFDGVEQPTTYVSATTLRFNVNPALYTVGAKTVRVREYNKALHAASVNFTFT